MCGVHGCLFRKHILPRRGCHVKLEVEISVDGVETVHSRVAQRTQPALIMRGHFLSRDRRDNAKLMECSVAETVTQQNIVFIRGVATTTRRTEDVLSVHLTGNVHRGNEGAMVIYLYCFKKLTDLQLHLKYLHVGLSNFVTWTKLFATAWDSSRRRRSEGLERLTHIGSRYELRMLHRQSDTRARV